MTAGTNLKPHFSLITLILLIFFLGCSNSMQLPAPEKIGDKERSRVVSGKQAARVINKMHKQSVAADANAIVEYGREKKDILYISYYEDRLQAQEAFNLMIEKMAAAKQGPFSHLMPLPTYQNRAYFTLGMGARHYIYISGNYLLWFQTVQSFWGELPPGLLKLYPITSTPAAGQSV